MTEREPRTPKRASEESEAELSERYYQEAINCYIRDIKYPEGTEPRPESIPQLRVEFEAAYIGSFTDKDAFIDHVLDELGWHHVLRAALRQGGIPACALAWDYHEVFVYLSRYYRIYRNDESVLHVFGIPEVRPLAPEQFWTGGRP